MYPNIYCSRDDSSLEQKLAVIVYVYYLVESSVIMEIIYIVGYSYTHFRDLPE